MKNKVIFMKTVRSDTNKNNDYCVRFIEYTDELKKWACSCKGHVLGGVSQCKHIRRAKREFYKKG